jgi:hypothetical protein
MRYIDTAMELARKNINPMAPPNSGPKENIYLLVLADQHKHSNTSKRILIVYKLIKYFIVITYVFTF